MHLAVAAAGLFVSAFLLMARRKLGWGALSDFVQWTSLGLIVLSFFHLFEDAMEFLELETLAFFGEHAIMIAGIALVWMGALELQKLSQPVKSSG